MKLIEVKEYARVKEFMDTVALDEWTKNYFLHAFARTLPEVAARKEEVLAHFEWPGITKYAISSEVKDHMAKFGICTTFDSREMLLAFCNKFELTLPTNVIKSGRVDSELKATTSMIYAFEQDGYKFNLSYTRAGFPTKSCRVVRNTEFAVACDIDGSDDDESKDDVL